MKNHNPTKIVFTTHGAVESNKATGEGDVSYIKQYSQKPNAIYMRKVYAKRAATGNALRLEKINRD